MNRERSDQPVEVGHDRYRAITAFVEGVIIYDPDVEGAWIESDAAVVPSECR